MVGILNLKETVRTESFKPLVEENNALLFLHLEHVSSLKNKLKNFTLTKDELGLVEYTLNKLPYTPSGYRFEASQTQQTNLLYRAEGIIGDIWEKIKAFFKWIVDKIKSLLGIENSKTPEKQEVKETQEQFHKFDYNPDNDPFIKNLKKQTEQLKKDTEKLRRETEEMLRKSGSSDILNQAEDILEDLIRESEKKPISKEKKEKMNNLKNKFSSKLSERPSDDVSDVEIKLAESVVVLSLSTLSDLEKLDKVLYEKAKTILSKMENVLPSSLSDKDFNTILKSNCGFVELCSNILKKITEKDITDKLFDFSSQELKNIPGAEKNHELAKNISEKNISAETFISFNGNNYSLFEFKFEPLSITKETVETPKKAQNQSDSENFNRLVEICKNTDLEIYYRNINVATSMIELSKITLLDFVKNIEKIIDKASANKEPSKEFNENISFIKDLCNYATQATVMENSYREKVTNWVNSLLEFEKILTEAKTKIN